MNIKEWGAGWSLGVDVFLGVNAIFWGTITLLAVKKKWDRFLLPEYNPLAKMLGKEFAESTALLVGILLVVIGGLLLVKAGITIF